jgi:hypothetical protein
VVRLLVAEYKDTTERKCEAPTRVESVKEPVDSLKVVLSLVTLPYSYHKVIDVVHHAGLKEMLQKVVVDNSPSGFNLDYCVGLRVYSIGVEVLLQ